MEELRKAMLAIKEVMESAYYQRHNFVLTQREEDIVMLIERLSEAVLLSLFILENKQ